MLVWISVKYQCSFGRPRAKNKAKISTYKPSVVRIENTAMILSRLELAFCSPLDPEDARPIPITSPKMNPPMDPKVSGQLIEYALQ